MRSPFVIARRLLLLALVPTALACPTDATIARVCETNTSRCGPESNAPEVCVSNGTWERTAPEPCADDTACCLIQGIDGRPIHACGPIDRSACLDESIGQPVYPAPAAPARTPESAGDSLGGGAGAPLNRGAAL